MGGKSVNRGKNWLFAGIFTFYLVGAWIAFNALRRGMCMHALTTARTVRFLNSSVLSFWCLNIVTAIIKISNLSNDCASNALRRALQRAVVQLRIRNSRLSFDAGFAHDFDVHPF